jgi:3-hydroxyacyl-CoA dehydrogenase
LPFADGLKAERDMFMELLATDQSKGMIHAFFNERAVSNLPELKGVETRALNSIGVIGGGTMGAGIATAALLSKLTVVLIETGDEQASAAKARIAGNLAGALKRGKITQDQHDALLKDQHFLPGRQRNRRQHGAPVGCHWPSFFFPRPYHETARNRRGRSNRA